MMMRNYLVLLLVFLGYAGSVRAQADGTGEGGLRYKIMLAGASFAYPQNGWFETGCKKLGAGAVNKALGSGGSVVTLANAMAEGSFYTPEELDETDAFVIMHVHDRDVYTGEGLKEDLSEYRPPFGKDDYAAAYDYVIKKYITDCFRRKDNPASKYYGLPHGKPASIVLCTHWHDSREIYNRSVRQLARKWGFPLIEFDKYIGFGKEQVHPVTKEQHSLIYAVDTQDSGGVKYGWHPVRGENSYIQQRMAAVFTDTMIRILPLRLPGASGRSAVRPPKISLFNGKSLDGWYTFLKNRGRDRDPEGVFAVKKGKIRISGEEWGCITTNEEYENYRLVIDFKWGKKTWGDRLTKARDSGVLLHSQGEDGGHAGIWMRSIEVQLIEGGTGDFIVIGNKAREFSIECPVAPEKQGKFYVYKPGGEHVRVYSGRVNWFGRDLLWEDKIDFRGKNDVEKKRGKWNRLECVAVGSKIDVYLNDVLVNQAINVVPAKGRIQIQSEGAELWIRKAELIPQAPY